MFQCSHICHCNSLNSIFSTELVMHVLQQDIYHNFTSGRSTLSCSRRLIMVVSNLFSCPYFLSSPGEPHLKSTSFVLTSVNTSAWTVRLISIACNEMLVFQLRQQHVHHNSTSQPGSIITHQRQEIDSSLARLSGMEVFHATGTLGFISTKGDTLN